jgi:hypothetical protein
VRYGRVLLLAVLLLIPPSLAQAVLCTLQWEPVLSTPLTGYLAYESVTSGYYPKAGVSVLAGTTTVTCDQLGLSVGDGMTHYFVVTAYNDAGQSGPSNEVSMFFAAPPPPPTLRCLKYNKQGKCLK